MLQSNEWLRKLSFYTGITKHINGLNLKLLGENHLLSDLWPHIKSFREKKNCFVTNPVEQNV